MTAGERRWYRDYTREQAKRKQAEEEAKRLKAAIREHHRQVVHNENWGADDELWATLSLRGTPESYAAERQAA